jgi:hypothetical protein
MRRACKWRELALPHGVVREAQIILASAAADSIPYYGKRVRISLPTLFRFLYVRSQALASHWGSRL